MNPNDPEMLLLEQRLVLATVAGVYLGDWLQ